MNKLLADIWLDHWSRGALDQHGCPLCGRRHRLLDMGHWVWEERLVWYYECYHVGRYLRIRQVDSAVADWRPDVLVMEWEEANAEMLALVAVSAEQF